MYQGGAESTSNGAVIGEMMIKHASAIAPSITTANEAVTIIRRFARSDFALARYL